MVPHLLMVWMHRVITIHFLHAGHNVAVSSCDGEIGFELRVYGMKDKGFMSYRRPPEGHLHHHWTAEQLSSSSSAEIWCRPQAPHHRLSESLTAPPCNGSNRSHVPLLISETIDSWLDDLIHTRLVIGLPQIRMLCFVIGSRQQPSLPSFVIGFVWQTAVSMFVIGSSQIFQSRDPKLLTRLAVCWTCPGWTRVGQRWSSRHCLQWADSPVTLCHMIYTVP